MIACAPVWTHVVRYMPVVMGCTSVARTLKAMRPRIIAVGSTEIVSGSDLIKLVSTVRETPMYERMPMIMNHTPIVKGRKGQTTRSQYETCGRVGLPWGVRAGGVAMGRVYAW